MGVLVFAEHDNNTLKPATLNTVTAALALGAPTVLVAGSSCQPVAEAAAKITGVEKVLVADAPFFAHPLAEAAAPLIVGLARGFHAPAGASDDNRQEHHAAGRGAARRRDDL